MENIKTKSQFRKIQGLIGESSFSVILPKLFASNLGIEKGDFVEVYQEDNKIIIQKAKVVN
ncbi:MAG: AbrB/MazE/SpoVT family DNA-binding domain-containing protein [Candidatus Nitrosocosmicus sp.]|jgi:bifunctional DNA-binding transcriptional regulator/antitoxin component of YhaV-PrlF toxin-antitoxin module|nr:AbrB/MazE/SpoVT family DNA-binding domain-containing protein [Candidatus Nitrosocosmicus sp.]